MERQYEDQEKQFKIYISDKRLVSKIYQEFWKCKKTKRKEKHENIQQENEQKTWKNMSPQRMYRWQINM